MTFKSLLFLVLSAFFSLASAQNLALNMPVTVTSTEGGLVGENAVDGSMSTRWSSAFRSLIPFRWILEMSMI